MSKVNAITWITVIVLLLNGCAQIGDIRISSDTPDSLEHLIADHEFMRARQLTGKYPELDSIVLQTRLRSLENSYEQELWEKATALETEGDLHAAVSALTEALQKMPHSDRLRGLRNTIEEKRLARLRINEREALLARGRHLVTQLKLFDDSTRLEPANSARLREQERNLNAAGIVASQLLTHTRYAMEENDLPAAMACLDLSTRLQDSQEAAILRDELTALKQSKEKTTRHKAKIEKARVKRKQTILHKEQTGKLLTETREALKDKQLLQARDTFMKIPASTSEDDEVVGVREQLENAINTRVDQLVSTGDSFYRADEIGPALDAWHEALELSPNNAEILERTERANKVLAKLEELKRKQ